MTEIGFYHLTRLSLEQALPRLLDRTLTAGHRAVVMCRSADRVAALDAGLWECSEPDFLPHGTAADGDADLQPIWISQEDEPPPNGARFLFLVDGREAARVDAFGRVFDLFDGNNEASVQAARERWKAAKSAGHDLTYWQQGPGGWEKKAESRAA